MLRIQSTAARLGPLRVGVRDERYVVWGVGALLVLAYVVAYLGTPKLPGNDPSYPLGWWGWFDQSMTRRSTAALAEGNLDPSQHHYPFGYSLLGLPFYWLLPNHTFFFPDLLSLLAAFAGYMALARRLALSTALAALVFLLTTACDRVMFVQWVVPWNTTPVAGLTWLLLACVAAWLDGRRRPWWIGLLAGGIVVCRPSDVVVLVPCFLTLAWAERADWRARVGDGMKLLASFLAVVLPVVALHFATYGAAQSAYMISSARIGFTLFDFGWKAYVLLVDPFPWFADGEGLPQHAHWLALGIAGIVPALLRGAKDRLLAAVLVVHSALYITYVDLLPTGLWRFLNVHYFIWAIPGFGMLASLLLRDLVKPRAPRLRWIGWASIVGTMLVLCLRVVPTPADENHPAKAVDFVGPQAPFWDTFLGGRLALRDSKGVLVDGADIRGFLYPGKVRVFGLRRDLVGPVQWLPGRAPQGYEEIGPSERWAPSVQLAWPPRWFRRAAPPSIPVPVS